MLEAEEGTYALLCFMPSPTGEPHVAEGMATTFDVGPAAAAPAAPAPTAEATVSEEEVPDLEIPAGDALIEVTNGGKGVTDSVLVAQIEERKDLRGR